MSKEVTFRNKFFKIIPEAKRVIGWMVAKDEDNYKDLSGIKDEHRELLVHAMYPYCDWFTGDAIKSIAVCDDRDTFDEKIGIDVCSAKLEKKNHLKMARKYDQAHRRLVESTQIAYAMCMYHYNKAKAIEEDLERTYGKGE